MNTWWIPFNTSSEELNHWWSFQSSTPPSGPKWRDSILNHDFEWGVLWMGQRNPNHQLKTVVYPIIYTTSTILLVVQDFATCPPYFVFEAFRLPKSAEIQGFEAELHMLISTKLQYGAISGTSIAGTQHIQGLCKGYEREYPHNIWPYVVSWNSHTTPFRCWFDIWGMCQALRATPTRVFEFLQYPPLPYIPMVRCVALCRLMSGWWFQMNILSI